MPYRNHRVVEPELMDDLPPEQTAASLRDIVRINRLTGHHVLLKTFAGLTSPDQPFSVLDVGAASGDAAAEITRAFPRARVTSLDYRAHHLRAAAGDRVVADAFQLPFRRAFDFVYCGLFLHHFDDATVASLLHRMASVARNAVVVNDLERHLVPYYFLPATRPIFRWHPLTVHDGTISVQAGFTERELRSLAARAGLQVITSRTYRPAFRIAMAARLSNATLSV